jgi:hypothetical protein
MSDPGTSMLEAGSPASLAGSGATEGLSTSRQNIPAICRIPGRGTGFLVSPGLIMTSTRVVGTKHEAARLTAVFFEGGKRPRVEVPLLPNQFYFAAAYPEHLDYCLVACDSSKIFNVTPVKLPLVQSEWAPVREGDTLFVVEHPVFPGGTAANSRAAAAAAAAATSGAAASPIGSVSEHYSANGGGGTSSVAAAAAGNALADEQTPVTVKRFVEVLRRRDDRMFAKAAGHGVSAGCPCFNDHGALVGLLSQVYDGETDTLTCSIVSIVSAVKHLFANGRISRIQQEPLFADVWSTWAVPGDTARIVSILANFTQKAIHRETSVRFFEHCHVREHVAGIIACGGTRVLLDTLRRHRGEVEFTHQGLRALWAVSFDVEDNRAQIREADGVRVILDGMRDYPDHEGVVQYSVVLLYNLTLTPTTVTEDWASEGLERVFHGATTFSRVEVLQKFAVGFFRNVAVAHVKYSQEMLDKGMVRHAMSAMAAFPLNEYLCEHAVRLVSAIVQSPRYHGAPALAVCVNPVVDAIIRFDGSNALRIEGSHALWGLGVDPRNRIAIFQHPRGAEALQLSVGVVSSTRSVD